MKNDYLKYYKPKVLIGIVFLISLALYYVRDNFSITFSVLGIITLIIITITEKLWNKKIFKHLFWIDDFSGRYEGTLIYQYIDEVGEMKTGELEHIKIIKQTGSQIDITSITKKDDGSLSSPSTNKGMYIEPTPDDQHFILIYSYLNDGCLEQEFPPHYGTEVIKFINNGKGKLLSGEYNSDRRPIQTRGKFKNLKWVSNNTNHDY